MIDAVISALFLLVNGDPDCINNHHNPTLGKYLNSTLSRIGGQIHFVQNLLPLCTIDYDRRKRNICPK
jgi:hypothetical protein